MEEEHYDTPWEFKNRAIAAALSQSASPTVDAARHRAAGICQLKASTSTDTRCDNEKRKSMAAGTLVDDLSSIGAPGASAFSAEAARFTRNSTSNVYTDDPSKPLAESNFVAFNTSAQRVLTQTGALMRAREIDLINHFPSTGNDNTSKRRSHCCARDNPNPALCSSVAAARPRESSRQALHSTTHYRRSYDGISSGGGGVSVVCDGEMCLHTPSTSSSSPSESPFSSINRHTTPDASPNNRGARRSSPRDAAYPLVSVNEAAECCWTEFNAVENETAPIACCCRCCCTATNITEGQNDGAENCCATRPPRRQTIPHRHQQYCVQNRHSSSPHHVGLGPSAGVVRPWRYQHSQQHPERALNEESGLIHEGMERQDAERLLKPLEVGDYLLRRRREGNLALSLLSTDGVLHIKLERRSGAWVLGEGPHFPTIGGMLRAYHKAALPVRGAEHVRLRSALTVADLMDAATGRR